MAAHSAFPLLPADPAVLAPTLFAGTGGRVLLFGESGVGKSTLARALALELAAAGRPCWLIGADPGSPALGVPGALALACWQQDRWQVRALAAVCSLDAARFRLPLALAVQQLAADAGTPLLIDAPGLVRGVAAAELLNALVMTAAVDKVLLIARPGRPPLHDELSLLPVPVWWAIASSRAYHAGKLERAQRRSELWAEYLAAARPRQFCLDRLPVLGTPPLRAPAEVWAGRQVAMLARRRTLAMGEVESLRGRTLCVRAPAFAGEADALLMRDAGCDRVGRLRTRQRPALSRQAAATADPASVSPPPAGAPARSNSR